MSAKEAVWQEFCLQHDITGKGVPLFATDGLTVRIMHYRTSLPSVLQRSTEMDSLLRTEGAKVVEDFRTGTGLYEGIIYMMYWIADGQVIPLYIGKTEKLGLSGNLSANMNPSTRGTFFRWGYPEAYHIGNLSAATLTGYPEAKRRKNYIRWAETLFESVPTLTPQLRQPAYFWATAWRSGSEGPWKELGSTPLTSLEHLLIALAAALFPETLLNVEGVSRR